MTEPAYRITRSSLTSDPCTAQYAREVYEKAQADPRAANLTGDALVGFAYDVLDGEGVKVGRIRVEPVPPSS